MFFNSIKIIQNQDLAVKNAAKLTKELTKIDWTREYVHPDWLLIPTFKGSQKAAFAHKKAVLIDDYQDNIDNWVEAGGIGILHKTADDTIKQLNDIINAE